jgi:hypothetical protein
MAITIFLPEAIKGRATMACRTVLVHLVGPDRSGSRQREQK